MSQRRDTLRVIERESGLEGLLLRPLSAKHFSPTIPELEGWVDREKLLAIQGRSRKEQMQLAEDLDVKNYPCPAGGCLLTEVSFVSKVRDVFDHTDQLNLRDFRLLKVGRHFRIGTRTKLIVGRSEAENDLLERSMQAGESAVRWLDGGSPLGVILGTVDEGITATAAKILLRYTKAEAGRKCRLVVDLDQKQREMTTSNDFGDTEIETYRV